jgi:magnesium transporter
MKRIAKLLGNQAVAVSMHELTLGALALNTVVAVSIGGTIPLALRRFGVDPAVASGPVLTTVNGMCGFFAVPSFASVALPMIQ